QNRWPSLGFDTGGLADRLSPLLPAGFYNKTFMWPAGAWPFYERMIRRMAGLGQAATLADPDLGPGYEQRHVWCDVLVVGGGAAGLMATLAAARSGARVMVCDEQAEVGGGLLAYGAGDGTRIGGRSPGAWRDDVLAELDRQPDVTVLPRTTAAAWHHGNYLVLAERVSDHLPPAARGDGVPRQRLWLVRTRQVILASGAHERPLIFADNDRPGVMLADAARTYANRYGVLAGRRAIVATGNDSAYRAALDLQAAGVAVAAIFDMRPAGSEPGGLARQVTAAGIVVRHGTAVVGSHGRKSLKAVRVRQLDSAGQPSGAEEVWPADLLAVSGGWTPVVHLWSQGRGTLRHDETIGAPVPARMAQAGRAVGAAAGTFDLGAALAEAAMAGHRAAAAAGFDGTALAPPAVENDSAGPAPVGPALFVPAIARAGGEEGRKAFVDLQNDVTDKDLKLALREGYRATEHVKRYTTTGMGTDQGKTANVNALAIIAEQSGVPLSDLPPTTFRPPYTPVTFGTLAGSRVGPLFDAERTTPLHVCHVAAGAHFEPVGQWQRAWFYPEPGEDMAAAVQREALATRRAAGLLDATTLGKIDIQGPDAVELLNRVYTNGWSTLAVGRARYGLMLGEDGMVMDDGVTTRLGEHHFQMTTTTGVAARVLAWVEELLQT
ncbi:MAG: FAD-dependent oxidoreductase, partial [Alphaproteobacteria bacterium]